MYYLKTSASFDSAHFLHGYEGKCSNLHGHHWVIEVTIAGEQLSDHGQAKGMLMDFGEMKRLVRALADRYDHTLIYEEHSLAQTTLEALRQEGFCMTPVCFRPTAENLARCFYETLRGQGLPVSVVTVYETPDNCAAYEGE